MTINLVCSPKINNKMIVSQDLWLQSDHDIVEMCRSAPAFAGSAHGNRLVKISKDVVVKFGVGVKREEAANQIYARRHVDNKILYVPRVFRFFKAPLSGFSMGFIVMEYVAGVNLKTLNVLDDPAFAKRTMDANQHLAMIPIPSNQGPGPVDGGFAQGYLWSDQGFGCTFNTITDMENWINARLEVVHLPLLSFAQHQRLTMRHMDLVRRNICILPDSSICFMDWAFADFFLDIFEIHIFRELLDRDEVWFSQLLHLCPKPDAGEEWYLLQYLGIPAVVNNKYS